MYALEVGALFIFFCKFRHHIVWVLHPHFEALVHAHSKSSYDNITPFIFVITRHLLC